MIPSNLKKKKKIDKLINVYLIFTSAELFVLRRAHGGGGIYSATRMLGGRFASKKKILNSRNIIMGRPSKQSHLSRAANGGQPRKGLYSMFICTQRRLFVEFR